MAGWRPGAGRPPGEADTAPVGNQLADSGRADSWLAGSLAADSQRAAGSRVAERLLPADSLVEADRDQADS